MIGQDRTGWEVCGIIVCHPAARLSSRQLASILGVLGASGTPGLLRARELVMMM